MGMLINRFSKQLKHTENCNVHYIEVRYNQIKHGHIITRMHQHLNIVHKSHIQNWFPYDNGFDTLDQLICLKYHAAKSNFW